MSVDKVARRKASQADAKASEALKGIDALGKRFRVLEAVYSAATGVLGAKEER